MKYQQAIRCDVAFYKTAHLVTFLVSWPFIITLIIAGIMHLLQLVYSFYVTLENPILYVMEKIQWRPHSATH